MVSHHVPMGSRPRAEGSNRDCGAAADGVQGQYLFLNLAGALAIGSIPGTAQTVHWDILHKRLERPPDDWPASCPDGFVYSGGHCFIEEEIEA